jgi:hypothetical protein
MKPIIHSIRCPAYTSPSLKTRGHITGNCTCDAELIAFVEWRESESWQEDYRYEKTHTIQEQLYFFRQFAKNF